MTQHDTAPAPIETEATDDTAPVEAPVYVPRDLHADYGDEGAEELAPLLARIRKVIASTMTVHAQATDAYNAFRDGAAAIEKAKADRFETATDAEVKAAKAKIAKLTAAIAKAHEDIATLRESAEERLDEVDPIDNTVGSVEEVNEKIDAARKAMARLDGNVQGFDSYTVHHADDVYPATDYLSEGDRITLGMLKPLRRISDGAEPGTVRGPSEGGRSDAGKPRVKFAVCNVNGKPFTVKVQGATIKGVTLGHLASHLSSLTRSKVSTADLWDKVLPLFGTSDWQTITTEQTVTYPGSTITLTLLPESK